MSTYNRFEGPRHVLKFHFCCVTDLEGLEREQDFLLTFTIEQAPPFYATMKVGFSLLIGMNTNFHTIFVHFLKRSTRKTALCRKMTQVEFI